MIDCSKTENYLNEKARMTDNCLRYTACVKCRLGYSGNGKTLNCIDFESKYPDKAIEIVQKWSNEHPKKTILDKLLEVFPNARLYETGTPFGICPRDLGYEDYSERCDSDSITCKECWNQEYKEGD